MRVTVAVAALTVVMAVGEMAVGVMAVGVMAETEVVIILLGGLERTGKYNMINNNYYISQSVIVVKYF